MVEATARQRTYYRHLGMLDGRDFDEAVDRVLYLDDWFPTVARLRYMAQECRADRARQRQAAEAVRPLPPLVCPYCHGSRWVRYGGYDSLHMQAGDEGSRVQPCHGCTTNGQFDKLREQAVIHDEGGVPNPEPPREVDMSRVTWPAKLAEFRDPATGRVDMEALYASSRELRGLDPWGDDRPEAVEGFGTVGRPRATAPTGAH
ncbi:MAG TPA: hypothetical protein PKA95_08455 [Thermomicrobiales bacterium]|nr:hypothetical protein [Thermomicrobiales bacterium]